MRLAVRFLDLAGYLGTTTALSKSGCALILVDACVAKTSVKQISRIVMNFRYHRVVDVNEQDNKFRLKLERNE